MAEVVYQVLLADVRGLLDVTDVVWSDVTPDFPLFVPIVVVGCRDDTAIVEYGSEVCNIVEVSCLSVVLCVSDVVEVEDADGAEDIDEDVADEVPEMVVG